MKKLSEISLDISVFEQRVIVVSSLFFGYVSTLVQNIFWHSTNQAMFLTFVIVTTLTGGLALLGEYFAQQHKAKMIPVQHAKTRVATVQLGFTDDDLKVVRPEAKDFIYLHPGSTTEQMLAYIERPNSMKNGDIEKMVKAIRLAGIEGHYVQAKNGLWWPTKYDQRTFKVSRRYNRKFMKSNSIATV